MSAESWVIYLVVFAGLVAWIVLRRAGQIGIKEAAGYVKQGAVIVDVRTPEEFSRGHLAQAFNMPLDELAATLPAKIKDRSRVILVHCQSGMRSKKAKSVLTGLGYQHVFDLGSYERAFKIVTGRAL